MDWKLILTTFGIVFVAEIGDKTQLAALALSGRSGRPLTVFVGAVCALVLATLIGVAAGAGLSRVLPEKIMEVGAALLFIAVGVFLLLRSIYFGEPPAVP